MQVLYRTNKLQKICENAETAAKEYGKEMAEKIQQRIDEIIAADSVEDLVRYRIGKCHPLTGDRKGQYAMALTQPYRLVFIKKTDITVAVRIEEIIDYH